LRPVLNYSKIVGEMGPWQDWNDHENFAKVVRMLPKAKIFKYCCNFLLHECVSKQNLQVIIKLIFILVLPNLKRCICFRLSQTASDLVPVGVFNELAPERPGLLSDRLSAGLVRALIAAGLEFESLQDLMVSAGVKGSF
jgi:hypothetical protein